MSIALVVTRGYSNGTLVGEVKDVTTRGYTVGEDAATWTVQANESTVWTVQANQT